MGNKKCEVCQDERVEYFMGSKHCPNGHSLEAEAYGQNEWSEMQEPKDYSNPF